MVITEGELDTLAVSEAYYQIYKTRYAVVSIPSATGMQCLLSQREWVRSFESVILLFDKDEAGKTAIEKAAKIIGIDKVKIGKLNEKDPCDELMKNGARSITNIIWNAKTYSPAGVMVGEEIWKKYKERRETKSIPYPECLDGLNNKLKGIRHGEIVLFTSGTGSGKSTVIKEIILDLLTKTEDKVGLISLEESIADTADKFISMAIRQNTSTENDVPEESLREGYSQVFGSEKARTLRPSGFC